MIGLFFGDTDFPKLILNKIKKNKKKYFIIDLSKNNIFKKELNSYRINIGQFGKILNLIKKKKCKKVIFAGKINKPNFSELKLDIIGFYYISRVIRAAKKGDAAILKELIKILSIEKIKVISSTIFNPELSLSKGNYTKLKPNKIDLRDIKKGIKELNKSNAHDHVQGLVVRNDTVIAKESINGTKKMLQRIMKAKNKTGTFIKFPKRKQDLRADLPTIGIDTLKDCKIVGLKGIALKSKQHVFLDKKKSINFANKNKMFITII